MSTQIRTVLVDDEQDSLELMKLYITRYFPQIEIVGTFNTSTEALKEIPELEPDLIFLDIEMPVMNGFELLSQLKDIEFSVVFVTAYNQFAVQAFRFNALDYIVKPVSPDDLRPVIEKAEKKMATSLLQVQMVSEQLRKGVITRIAVPSHNGISFIDLSDIEYVESNSNYSNIKLTDGRSILISKTLKDVQDLLEMQHFMRIHRQYIINLNAIKHFNKNMGIITMFSGDELPVSRNHKDHLLERFRFL